MRALVETLALTCCTLVSGTVYSWRYSFVGTDFFSGWSFWTAKDPSRGSVKYVGFTEAVQARMINATPARVYIGADTAGIATEEGRRSVRIESRATYNEGLFVATIDHVPTGCSLWPAFWMYGEDGTHEWPSWGEFDIIEGAHRAKHVMTSLHTNAKCDQSLFRENLGVKWMSGPSGTAADNCNVVASDQFENQGCSQRGPAGSLGTDFNNRGGGTYAAEWDPLAKSIRTWFWPRGFEPADLLQQRPNPDSWGLPYSYFSLDPAVCSPKHFVNMKLVFDITFCGDLAGPTFDTECPEMAAEKCPDFARKYPEHLREAFWSIRVLDVYQKSWFEGAQQPPSSTFVGAVQPEGVPMQQPMGQPGQPPPRRAWWLRTQAIVIASMLLVFTIFSILGFTFRKFLKGTRCPPFAEHCFSEVETGTIEEQIARHTRDQPDGVVWGDEGMRIPFHSSNNHHTFVFHDPITGESRAHPPTPTGQFPAEGRRPVGSMKRVVSL